ncbi:hypothetical protein [Acetobacter sicerae]|uniref:hypothetical protein n=1 Tax=Acetobacter sicerae TaxID=85325 RepID=UPI00156BC946|nr:hypothetical protein [Acetobacter sicerae]NHN91117.1 hypothetical protein [Acetobacter sicerae]
MAQRDSLSGGNLKGKSYSKDQATGEKPLSHWRLKEPSEGKPERPFLPGQADRITQK